jgi:hypothetical protein
VRSLSNYGTWWVVSATTSEFPVDPSEPSQKLN